MIPIVTLEGPTASGKSDLALRLAAELGTEIISADSRQVYRYLDIGTAKPPPEDLEAVKHHLTGIIEPSESYNVGRFCADARKIIQELHQQGKIPIVCGGTGLYVAGLLRGIFPQIPIPAAIRSELKQRLASEGLAALYDELKERDPDFAARISSQDRQRVLRGLEVYQATGIPITRHWSNQAAGSPYRAFRILLDPPRQVLYERINRRIGQMLESGLLEEIKAVLAKGFNATDPGLNSLGYKEFLPHILEGADLDECAQLAAQHTRNYAKRQCTWYRKYKFHLTLGSPECILSEVTGHLAAWLD